MTAWGLERERGSGPACVGLGWGLGGAGGRGLVWRPRPQLPLSGTLAEDPAYTPRECFQRISRRLRAVLKRSRIPMVRTRPGLALPACLVFFDGLVFLSFSIKDVVRGDRLPSARGIVETGQDIDQCGSAGRN